MTENLHVECTDCKEPMEKKIEFCSGLHFKGNGFYETDYKGK